MHRLSPLAAFVAGFAFAAAAALAQFDVRDACASGMAPDGSGCLRQAGSSATTLPAPVELRGGLVAVCPTGDQGLYFFCFNPEAGHVENANVR